MQSLQNEVKEVVERKERKIERQSGELPRTVFETLLESDLPAEEKSPGRLWQEALLVIGAGTDTTSNALVLATFHLLRNSEQLAILRGELEKAMPHPSTPAKLIALEKLPYLSACIQESLRFNYGISSRLARISPNEDTKYKEYSIPAGTPVGMTSVFTHHNEDIFPNSYSFLPERWLGDGGRALDKYMLSFSRGSRACIGIK